MPHIGLLPLVVSYIPDLVGDKYDQKSINSKNSSSRDKITAAYDYLSAVYGDWGGKFDKFLSLRERFYAEQTFGKIKDAKDIPNFLRLAQNRFFQRPSVSLPATYCQDLSKFHLALGGDSVFGASVALGGVHHCGVEFGNIFLFSGVELLIASDPKKWIFFIEFGSPDEASYKNGSFHATEEQALFLRIGERLGIPIENSIVPLDSKEVAAQLQAEGIPWEKTCFYLVMSVFQSVLDVSMVDPQNFKVIQGLTVEQQANLFLNGLKESIPSYFSQVCQKIMLDSGDHSQKFFKFAEEELAPDITMISSADHMKSLYQRNEEFLSKSTRISNDLSVPRLKKLLKASGKTHAYFQMGSAHLPIIKEIYSDTQEIPLNDILPNAPVQNK